MIINVFSDNINSSGRRMMNILAANVNHTFFSFAARHEQLHPGLDVRHRPPHVLHSDGRVPGADGKKQDHDLMNNNEYYNYKIS